MTSGDEMCNLYIMYYTDRNKGTESAFCAQEMYPDITANLPLDSDEPLPSNPMLEEQTQGENLNKV